MRIYCDQHIFSYLNQESSNFNSELKELMENLDDLVIFLFSEAHLQDLSNSLPSYRNRDLKEMGKYVKDNYLAYNPIKEETEAFKLFPDDAYTTIDFDLWKKFPHDLTSIYSFLKGNADSIDERKLISSMEEVMNAFLNLPIHTFQNIPDETRIKVNEYFPDSELYRIKDFVAWTSKLLTDKSEVKNLKRFAEDFYSSNDYSYEKFGLSFDERFKKGKFGISFFEMMEMIINEQNYNFYNQFILYFLSLETLNITKDKSLRKTPDLLNISTDAEHSWFASFSDYFVTEDKGLIKKAEILYNHFGINTKIIGISEFLELGKYIISQNSLKLEKVIRNLNFEVANCFITGRIIDQEPNLYRIVKPKFPILNYFNRIDNNIAYILLYNKRVNHANRVLLNELELVSKILFKHFGIDSDRKGEYVIGEKIDVNNYIRRWIFNNNVEFYFSFIKLIGGGESLGLFIKANLN